MEPDVDAAIETAANRTRQAQERLIAKERRTIAVVPEAKVVEHRAEDLRDLASAAADEESAAEESAGEESAGDDVVSEEGVGED
jgi:hypothetical protein